MPLAAGAAWAHQRAGTGDVAVTYFGDGAVNIGSVLETMNLAAAWKLPLCFFIENNRYAVSTTVEEVDRRTAPVGAGLAFAIPSWQVDGMDPLAVYLAMQEALCPSCAPATGRRSSRLTSIATFTRMARCRGAPLVIVPKQRKRSGGRAIRSTAWRASYRSAQF